MAETRLKQLIRTVVRQTMAEQQQQTVNTDPETGTVTVVNTDGTVDVTTATGTNYQNVGAAVVFTVGAQVLVITADGKKVAIPR